REFGISRKTGYKWRERYEAAGPTGLGERTSAPHRRANATPLAIEEAILAFRREHTRWGPRLLRSRLLLLDEAKPYLFLVTLNGADSHPAKTAMPNAIQTLGKGTYDMPALLKKLKAIGFKGPIGLQCFNIKGDPQELLTGSMGAWKKISNVLE
ncbi:MAG: helix-turn-helix domain-containing protein, partial [Kiritimatiellaeota bacterium]|nr:helix-turn-helix domain-containing protein [Kiritimatiellota bacterium]